MVALETVTNQYLGGDTSLACSPETARAIDEEVIKTVKEQYEKAMEILKEHAGKLNELSALSSGKGDHHRRRVHGNFKPIGYFLFTHPWK